VVRRVLTISNRISLCHQQALKAIKAENRVGEWAKIYSSLINLADTGIISEEGKFEFTQEES
jgi:hypothetical protein